MRRSMLFMPGNNAGMLLNADILGADSIILDLEDAVSPDEKDSARVLVRNAIETLKYPHSEVIVRINSIDTPYWEKDLTELIPLCPGMIMLPKTSCASDVHIVDGYIAKLEGMHKIPLGTVKLIPLIETALGIENSYQISSSAPRVKAILLGGEDLTADLCCKRTKAGNEIAYARSKIVCACRAAGIDCYDTPFTDVNDDDGIKIDANLAKSLGFTGKSAISPRHVPTINEVFSPTAQEISYALEVLHTIKIAKEQGRGVVALRGKMIDAPIVARANKVIETARSLGVNVDE